MKHFFHCLEKERQIEKKMVDTKKCLDFSGFFIEGFLVVNDVGSTFVF
jgi:hypothetical protein